MASFLRRANSESGLNKKNKLKTNPNAPKPNPIYAESQNCRACGEPKGSTFKIYCGRCIREQWGMHELRMPEEVEEKSYCVEDPATPKSERADKASAFGRSKSSDSRVE